MKKLLLSIALLFSASCLSAWAESCLVLQMRDGNQHLFVLSQQPRLSFAEGSLIMTSAEAEAAFALSDIENFHFADQDMAIGRVEANDSRFSFVQGQLTIEGFAGLVTICDANGRTVCSMQAGGQTPFGFNLGDCPKGAYMVRFGQHVVKLYNK